MALAITLIVHGVVMLFPDIGWSILAVYYVLIMVGVTTHYWLTSRLWWPWIALSFLLNFPLWVFEQVQLEHHFEHTFLYSGDTRLFWVSIIGGSLWAFNKIAIDGLLLLFPVVRSGLREAQLRWV